MSIIPITVHHPRFDNDENTIKNAKYGLQVISPHQVSCVKKTGIGARAIANESFPSNVDGIHVFAVQIIEIKNAIIRIGWAPHAGIWLQDGNAEKGGLGEWEKCFGPGSASSKITKQTKELVLILTISENGMKNALQFVVNGNESKVIEIEKSLTENGATTPKELKPEILMKSEGQVVQVIPFDQVSSTSPKIEELKMIMKEQGANEKKNPVVVAPPPASTNTNERKEEDEKDKKIQELQKQLEAERAAHDKSRQQLNNTISGQRRQRE